MRPEASVLHLDLDAFFASVEQRDKPSLAGKPVIVGGIGQRGVVSTASYEARRSGVGSAMPMSEARRRAPHAAYLAGRFDAYRESSRVVMVLLRQVSPQVEPLSLDEAFVDLAAAGLPDLDPAATRQVGEWLRAQVQVLTEGLTASVGIGTSKFVAKMASELAKPNGLVVVEPGTEVATIAPLSARMIPGIGPVTMASLDRLGIRTVADLQRASVGELTREVGRSWGESLHALAFADDDRPIQSVHETKQISVEDTFETDRQDVAELNAVLDRDAAHVVAQLARRSLFARTVTIKVRLGDFTTWTRSHTLTGATDSADRVARVARGLLAGLDLAGGVRLLGLGVSGFAAAAQEELFEIDLNNHVTEEVAHVVSAPRTPFGGSSEHPWPPGCDVEHEGLGRGWVWGSGLGRVTVRFEHRGTAPGPVRTFASDDPALTQIPGLPLRAAGAASEDEP